MKQSRDSLKEPKPGAKHWNDEIDWAFAHYHELVKLYPNEWVAVGHKRVLAHGKALMPVLMQARRQIHWRDIPHLFVEKGIHVYACHSA